MKIDLDLEEIFNEEGSVEDSIKERIVQAITQRISAKVEKTIAQTVDSLLKEGVKEQVSGFLSKLIPDLMNYEFQETSRYGETKEEKTTVKNKILKILQNECVYKAARSGYSNEQNAFTSAMQNIIAEQMKLYKPQFDKEINALFVKEAMDYAQESLKKRLGIK